MYVNMCNNKLMYRMNVKYVKLTIQILAMYDSVSTEDTTALLK